MKKYLFLIPLVMLFTGCFNSDKKERKKVDVSSYEQTQKQEIKRETPKEAQKHFTGGGYGSNGGSHYYKKKKKRLF